MNSKTYVLALASTVALAACGSDDHGHPPDGDLVRAEIIDRGQTSQPVIAEWNAGEGWDGELPEAGIGEDNRLSLGVRMYDADGDQLIEREGEYTARYALADGAATGVLDLDGEEIFHGDHVHIYGAAEGSTEIIFVLWHDDHVEASTTPISITVADDADVYREMQRVEIRDRGQTDRPIVATWEHGEGWDGELMEYDLASAERERLSLGVDIYDSNDVLLHEDSDEWTSRFYVPSSATGGVVNTELDDATLFHGDHVHVYAIEEGTTELVFVLWHEDHSEAETSPIDFTVTGEVDELVHTVEIRNRAETGDPVVAIWRSGDGWLEEDDDENELPGLPSIGPVVANEDTPRVSLGVDIYDSLGRLLILPGFGYQPSYGIDSEDPSDVLSFLGDEITRNDDVVTIDEEFIFHADHVHIYGKADGTEGVFFELWDIEAEESAGETEPVDIEVEAEV